MSIADDDDLEAQRRRRVRREFEGNFKPDPNPIDIGEFFDERERELARLARYADREVLRRMRDATAEPVDCAAETLRPLAAELGSVPVPMDWTISAELHSVIANSTCTRQPSCEHCNWKTR
jgi:hypothetical protein